MPDFIGVDRDCVLLDGNCDCTREEGKLPDCKKYKFYPKPEMYVSEKRLSEINLPTNT